MDMDQEGSPGPHEASEALNSGLNTSCDLQILHPGGDPSEDYNEIKKVGNNSSQFFAHLWP